MDASSLALACLLLWAAPGSEVSPDDPDPRPTAEEPALNEQVTVTAARLAEEPEPLERLPAHVTVLDRERIERSGARTLQDLLAREAGVIVYDQVGNDVEKTLDLRGFAGGRGTRVYLDGAPINDPRNNALDLDLIPLEALERIEITRGSVAALAGGGSEAGVIHLLSRHGQDFGGRLSLAGGSFDTGRYAGEVGGRTGKLDYFISGASDDTGGFRQNAGGDRRRLAATIGSDVREGSRLELSLVDARSELGNPGALTREELQSDPWAAPFNRVDSSDEHFGQAALNFRGPLSDAVSLVTNLFVQDREGDSLTTGRSASESRVRTDTSVAGATVQVTHQARTPRAANRLTAGVEWLEGDTDAAGDFVFSGFASQSRNTVERRTGALFVQDVWEPVPAWSLLAGVRADHDRAGFEDTLAAGSHGSRRFSEVSLRAGASWNPAGRHGFYASYGEAFLPPTAEDLYAFPGFGSNPDLEPQDSRSYEAGWRARVTDSARLELSLFRIDTTDEILFVFDPLAGIGMNRNIGETRRDGVEASVRGHASRRLELYANLTLTDAEFTDGDQRGREVPLVPGEQLAVGLHVELPHGVAASADGRYAGDQVLDGDDTGQRRLGGYTVVDARASWSHREFALFAEAWNLLDHTYATRGIYSPFLGQEFVTPAPGRRWLVGAEWRF